MLKSARWISYPEETEFACPVFQKEFKAKKDEVKKASLTITSLGCYYAELNGQRVGDFILAPGCTSSKRVQAQTYNITDMLLKDNRINITLSKGWFKGRIRTFFSKKYCSGIQDSIIAEISILYKDGSIDKIATDKTWLTSISKTIFADFYDGETYDSTHEENFVPSAEHDYSKDIIVSQQGEIIKEQERIAPHSIFTTPKGETIIDFAQNMTGYFEFTVDAKEGDKVSFSFAEVLDKDGNFYNENYRTAKADFTYICKNGVQTYKPKLVFYGFRYIRVNSFPTEISSDNITAIAVYSDIKRTGYLESSDKLLNKLFENIIWGQRGNFLDVPTDCPQRDERLGWTGDAQVFVKTASYNYDVEKFFKKWLSDLALDQFSNGAIPHVIPYVFEGENQTSAAWGEASTVCPWQIYITYGDKDILKRQYSSMCKYVKYIGTVSKNRYLWTGCTHFGDWLGLDAAVGSLKGSSNEDFIASVFYAYSVLITKKAGHVLGKNVEKYEKLYDNIIKAVRKKFKTYKTQTEHVLALYFDIAEDKASVAKSLADMIEKNGNCLQTGFVGTPYLLHALSQNGYTELAYTLLLQEKFPSWLYSVKCGATTIWEHWDSQNENGDFWSKDMNSFNHYAYGSVADWVYGVACGINPIEDKPGFEEIVISPHPTDKIDFLSASIETRHGLVKSKWYHSGAKIRYEIITPVKTTVIINGKEHKVEKGSYIF